MLGTGAGGMGTVDGTVDNDGLELELAVEAAVTRFVVTSSVIAGIRFGEQRDDDCNDDQCGEHRRQESGDL